VNSFIEALEEYKELIQKNRWVRYPSILLLSVFYIPLCGIEGIAKGLTEIIETLIEMERGNGKWTND
jgi:hypothetical protein